jgi:PadR family transcriptional regulator, regulatory protein PadR
MPRKKKDLISVTSREELILLALHGKELYGLEIQATIALCSDGNKQIADGTLYPVLQSLQSKGLIASRWGDGGESDRGGARRRYYHLTGEGRSAIEWVQEFREKLMNHKGD